MFYRQRRLQRERDTDPTRFKSKSRTEISQAVSSARATKKTPVRKGRKTPGSTPGAIAKPPPLPADSPWRIDAWKFPHTGSIGDKLRFVLRYAVLAPSSHNTQPWKFHVTGSSIQVWADRARALPVCDPEDRELTISVGCAIHHASLALSRFGVKHNITHLPDRQRPDLMAIISATALGEPLADDIRLCDAILARRTVRRAFDEQPVPPAIIKELVEACQKQGATLHVIDDAETRFRLAKLVAEADIVQFCNRGFRRELAMWMHHNRTSTHDGIPGFAMGMTELESIVAPLVVRTFDMGDNRAAKDEQLALHSPMLAVLASDRDAAKDWLAAGEALSALLLTATRAGLSASYLNQPVEIPETRLRLKQLASGSHWPQLILRLGYAPPSPTIHTPRRGLDEVLVDDQGKPIKRKPAKSKR